MDYIEPEKRFYLLENQSEDLKEKAVVGEELCKLYEVGGFDALFLAGVKKSYAPLRNICINQPVKQASILKEIDFPVYGVEDEDIMEQSYWLSKKRSRLIKEINGLESKVNTIKAPSPEAAEKKRKKKKEEMLNQVDFIRELSRTINKDRVRYLVSHIDEVARLMNYSKVLLVSNSEDSEALKKVSERFGFKYISLSCDL